jgi:hypothetical protein
MEPVYCSVTRYLSIRLHGVTDTCPVAFNVILGCYGDMLVSVSTAHAQWELGGRGTADNHETIRVPLLHVFQHTER